MINLYNYHTNPELLDKYTERFKYLPWEVFELATQQNKRIPELEHVIVKDPHCAFLYAERIIKGKWPEAEPYIKTDNVAWNNYRQFVK